MGYSNPNWLDKKIGNVTGDQLLKHFRDYLNESEKMGFKPDKLSWMAFLNITRATYSNWQTDKLNLWMSEVEFSERLSIIKKIEQFLENDISQSMMASSKPTGMIFYLKNAFNWADKQDAPEIKVAISGYSVPKLSDKLAEKDAKSDEKSDKITGDNL